MSLPGVLCVQIKGLELLKEAAGPGPHAPAGAS